MDDWRIEGIAFCAGIEDAVSGVGEEVVEGMGGGEMNNKGYLKIYWQDYVVYLVYGKNTI